MKRGLLLAIALLVVGANNFASAQEGSAQEGFEAPKPTEHHAMLKKEVGTWDADVKFWMAGPDAEPMVSKGSEVNEMFGEFFVMSKFTGSIMGMEFQGRGTLGYHPGQKKYVGTWCDTMSPGMSHMVGTYDNATNTMTMIMTGMEPDGTPTKAKNVVVYKDKNTRMFTMSVLTPGTEDEYVKQMEITYKRR